VWFEKRESRNKTQDARHKTKDKRSERREARHKRREARSDGRGARKGFGRKRPFLCHFEGGTTEKSVGYSIETILWGLWSNPSSDFYNQNASMGLEFLILKKNTFGLHQLPLLKERAGER
jgi:hypothetical protein